MNTKAQEHADNEIFMLKKNEACPFSELKEQSKLNNINCCVGMFHVWDVLKLMIMLNWYIQEIVANQQNRHKIWTQAEGKILAQLVKDGLNDRDISFKMKRSERTIKRRRLDMGMKRKKIANPARKKNG